MSPQTGDDVAKTAHIPLTMRSNCNFSTFLSQKTIYALFLSRKRFTHFICCEKRFRHFFVAKTIYALRLESFCALNFAIRKVKTFWASVSEFSLAIESAVFHIYQNTADSRTRLNYENCGRICDSNTA